MLNFLRNLRGLAAPERKRSRVGPLIALHEAGRPVWTPRDYAALAREGYERNPVVHRCVRLIAEAAAQTPLIAKVGLREMPEHPALALIDRPNPRQGGIAFREMLFGHLLVAGNAYVEAASVGAEPRELYALRPDRMKIVPGRDGWPEGYDYTVGGDTIRFRQDDGGVPPILHLTLFHPVDDHYGLSPIEAAACSLDIHNAASNWHKALLDNAARPSGALVYDGPDGSSLSDVQFERLKAELEESFQGARNAGRPLLLEGGLDWKPLSLTPAELDFVAAKGGVKLLWQHDPAEPIGRWISLAEDSRGLFVRGQLSLAVTRAREIHALMREGAIDGLSIGFRSEKARTEPRGGLRRLERIDLWEISIVTFPMLPQARVSAVKALRGALAFGQPAFVPAAFA